MAHPAIAGEVHQALDVHRGFAPQVTLDGVVGIDRFTNLEDFSIAEILHATAVVDPQLVHDLLGAGCTDSVNIGQRDDHALVGGDIYPGNASH